MNLLNICDLYDDVIINIMEFLSDKDKINLLFLNKRILELMDKIHYNDFYQYDKIKHLSFYHRFKKISYIAINDNIPDEVTHLTLTGIFIDTDHTGSKLQSMKKLQCITMMKMSQFNKYRSFLSPDIHVCFPTYEGKLSDYGRRHIIYLRNPVSWNYGFGFGYDFIIGIDNIKLGDGYYSNNYPRKILIDSQSINNSITKDNNQIISLVPTKNFTNPTDCTDSTSVTDN